MKTGYKKTMYACFAGYMVQAIVNNFLPLLFVTFAGAYSIPLSKITFLITINFMIQLCIDLVSTVLIDKIGYRASAILSHVFAALGLVMLTVLPDVLPDPYIGMIASVAVYAVGGGLLEVIISPIIEACPTENKERAMSLLHSFYCWGHVGVVLISTAFFALFGTENWKIMALLWAIVPAVNLVVFATAPMYSLDGGDQPSERIGGLFRNRLFWIFMLMMVCAGASEQAVGQWASAFAERGLGVSKALGDLAGPMAFAFLMGLSRLIAGKYSERIDTTSYMKYSAMLCIISYICIVFVPSPAVGLLGCAVCGFSVGMLWPGTYSMAAAGLHGGTPMFALLALAGDVGCAFGPTLAGLASSAAGDDMRRGILVAIVFPALMLVGILLAGKHKKDRA